MRLMRLPIATVTLVLVLSGVATVPGTVRAENALVKGVTMRMISRLTTQYLLLMVRTFVDLT